MSFTLTEEVKMKNIIISTLILLSATAITAQQDCEGCKDYSVLPRMPNYHITTYQEIEFDSEKYYFDKKSHLIEGKKIKIEYTHNNRKQKGAVFPSRLQILRNYSNAIEAAGGRVLFERKSSDHGYYRYTNVDGKIIWLKLRTAYSGNRYYLIIIEQEPMKQDLVINADLIKTQIDLLGKVAIYGIYFDVGKFEIKEKSTAALNEISKYLNENPSVKLWVVGHTDSDGSFELNSELSLNRSEAIRVELEQKYNIAQGRLFAEGVGPLAPVASNKTEEGKQKNRRVEFVLK